MYFLFSQLRLCSVKYFSIVKSFKYYFVVGSVIIGSVGRWVSESVVGELVSKWWVVGWSVVGGLVVGGFNKTHSIIDIFFLHNVSTLVFEKAFPQNSSDYLQRVLVCLMSQILVAFISLWKCNPWNKNIRQKWFQKEAVLNNFTISTERTSFLVKL